MGLDAAAAATAAAANAAACALLLLAGLARLYAAAGLLPRRALLPLLLLLPLRAAPLAPAGDGTTCSPDAAAAVAACRCRGEDAGSPTSAASLLAPRSGLAPRVCCCW